MPSRTVAAAFLPFLVCVSAHAETDPAAKLRLRIWSDNHYAGLVLGARQLGRQFREEDVISGAERHFHETLAQYCEAVVNAAATPVPDACGPDPDSLP